MTMCKTVKSLAKAYPFSFLWLCIVLLLSIFSPWVANEKPILSVIQNENNLNDKNSIGFYFNYRNEFLQSPEKFTRLILAPIPYSPGVSDGDNLGTFSPFDEQFYTNNFGEQKQLPLRFHHWMGTDARGCDVFSGIVHGTRYSLSIGFFSMLLALIIALVTGVWAGYYSSDKLRVNRFYFFAMLIASFFSWFFGYYRQRFVIKNSLDSAWIDFLPELVKSILIMILILLVFNFMAAFICRKYKFTSRMVLPVDGIITRITELFTAVPKIILVISLVAISKPSIFLLILVFGLMEWTDISRMVRAETMKLKQSGFVEASIAMGASRSRIIFKHLIPNLWKAVMPVFLYGISLVILTETGLSFLGIGVDPGIVTWGSLLAQGKENIQAWWLMLFPALSLLFTVLSLNNLGKHKWMEPEYSNSIKE